MDDAVVRVAPWLGWLFWPLAAAVRAVGAARVADDDISRWVGRRRLWGLPTPLSRRVQRTFLLLKPEFRGLVLFRLRSRGAVGWFAAKLLGFIYRGPVAFFVDCPHVGPGLYLEHAFATVINAEAIGEDCWINQQVTVGFGSDGKRPVLGDRVQVRAGAIVVGGVRVGDDAIVGAGAVVTKDVAPGHVAKGLAAESGPAHRRL